MKNSVVILYDPMTNQISMVKYGEFEVLLNLIESFKVIAMKMKEKFLFFQVDDDEKVFVNHIIDYSGQPISYLNNFRHAKYNFKGAK